MSLTSGRIISAQPGRQTAFLQSPADICIYGGAAGGGKPVDLILEPLRYATRVANLAAAPTIDHSGWPLSIWIMSETASPSWHLSLRRRTRLDRTVVHRPWHFPALLRALRCRMVNRRRPLFLNLQSRRRDRCRGSRAG